MASSETTEPLNHETAPADAAAPAPEASAQPDLAAPPASTAPAPSVSPSAKAPAARPWLIHRLTLRLDRLVVADHTGSKPSLRDYPLALNQSYTDVTDAKQLLVPDVLRRLAAAELLDAQFAKLIPGDLGRAFIGHVRDAGKEGATFLKETGRKTSEAVKGLFQTLEDSRKP